MSTAILIQWDMNSSRRQEHAIKGAVLKTSLEEEEHLWAGSSALRPSDHVEWLRHFVALEFGVARLLAGWVPAAGHLDWKLELPFILHDDMQHLGRLLQRLRELTPQETPFQPSPALAAVLAAIGPAEDAATFFHAYFRQLKPAVIAAYEGYLARCDAIIDGPTAYLLTLILEEKSRQLAWAEALFTRHPLVAADLRAEKQYQAHVADCLRCAGELTPTMAADLIMPASPVKRAAGPNGPTVNDPRLKLMDRFPLSKEESPVYGTLREIIYHNATEWQVVGPMCYVFCDMPKMPVEFFIDFARHIWDECRHAQMGFRRLREHGYDPLQDFRWPGGQLDLRPPNPEEYYAMLTLIGEACSFKRKQGSIVPFLRAGDPASALLPTIDCVDERLHVGFGNKWLPEIFRRVRGETKTLQTIGVEARDRFLEAREWTSAPADGEKAELSRNIPVFCSLIEFPHLDFTVAR